MQCLYLYNCVCIESNIDSYDGNPTQALAYLSYYRLLLKGSSQNGTSVTFFTQPFCNTLYTSSLTNPILSLADVLYPRYEVYRGYIVSDFSVIILVCLCVCLSVCKLFFLSKISQQLLELRLWNLVQSLIVMSCLFSKKNSHILLISPFICSFFFLSNGNFRHRFLSVYWSQC